MLCVGALWYGWTHERRNASLLAGLALGLSQYFYSSGRILIVLVLAWLTLVEILDRARFKRALISIGFLWLVAIVVVLPLGMFYRTPIPTERPARKSHHFRRVDGLQRSRTQPARLENNA